MEADQCLVCNKAIEKERSHMISVHAFQLYHKLNVHLPPNCSMSSTASRQPTDWEAREQCNVHVIQLLDSGNQNASHGNNSELNMQMQSRCDDRHIRRENAAESIYR